MAALCMSTRSRVLAASPWSLLAASHYSSAITSEFDFDDGAKCFALFASTNKILLACCAKLVIATSRLVYKFRPLAAPKFPSSFTCSTTATHICSAQQRHTRTYLTRLRVHSVSCSNHDRSVQPFFSPLRAGDGITMSAMKGRLPVRSLALVLVR
jgi:hypothetical protein